MQLKPTAPAALFCEILQHFCVADRSVGNVGLKEFAELIIHNIDACITLGFEALCYAFIEINHVKP